GGGCRGLRAAVRAGAVGRGAEALARGVIRGLGSGAAQLSLVRLPQSLNGRGCAGLVPPLGGLGRGLRRPSSPRQLAPHTKDLRGCKEDAREHELAYRSGVEAIARTPPWSERGHARAGWLSGLRANGDCSENTPTSRIRKISCLPQWSRGYNDVSAWRWGDNRSEDTSSTRIGKEAFVAYQQKGTQVTPVGRKL
ncbi:hypothetical protein P7K49_009655, partial [Saguinus oedipus]